MRTTIILAAAACLASMTALSPAAFATTWNHNNGMSADRTEARITQALNTLEANGYVKFSDVRAENGEVMATADKNGKDVNVTVDSSGQIHTS